ncbi:hypothetical protein R6Z07M_017343 [Ovis aries]
MSRKVLCREQRKRGQETKGCLGDRREEDNSGEAQSDLDAHFLPLSLSISIERNVIACSAGCKAIVDTGAAFIEGPKSQVDNMQKFIGARPRGSKYYVPCSAVNTLPSVIFTINSINYTVPGRAYILKNPRGRCYTTFKENQWSPSTEIWILGDVFLRLYFSVFDRGHDRIGLARAV